MKLVQHPAPADDFDAEYNQKVATDGFRRGDFTVYFDVFEDGDRLFSSYDLGEKPGAWYDRNVPVEMQGDNPFTRAFPIGGWPIPVADPATRILSLTEVELILRTNYRIALRGRERDPAVNLPNQNNMRQLLYSKPDNWAIRWIGDNENGILIRAVLAHKSVKAFDMRDRLAA